MADKIDGVRFGDIHSYDDLKLILVSRPTVKLGKAKTVSINIPGRNYSIDITEKLFGKVPQANTTLTFSFMSNEIISGKKWAEVLEQARDALHCKTLKIIMDEEPNTVYTGIVQITSFKCAGGRYDIGVSCDCFDVAEAV